MTRKHYQVTSLNSMRLFYFLVQVLFLFFDRDEVTCSCFVFIDRMRTMFKIFARCGGLLTKKGPQPLAWSISQAAMTTTSTIKPSSILEDFNRIINSETSRTQTAVIQDDVEISFDELNFNVNNLCLKLVNEYKLSKGDSIVHLSNVRIDAIQIQLACAKLGIIHVPIYTQSTKHQFESTMNLLKPSLIISDCKYPSVEEYIANNKEYTNKTIYLSDEFNVNNWLAKEFTSENDQLGLSNINNNKNSTSITGDVISTDDIFNIVFTSGTTGDPKGCVHTHKSIHYGAIEWEDDVDDLPSTDMFLCLVPQHGGMAIMQRWNCLCSGRTILFPNKEKFRDTFHWLDLIDKYPNNNIVAVFFGKAFSDLYSYSKNNINTNTNTNTNNHFSNLKYIIYGGDFVPLDIVDYLRKNLFNDAKITVGYGLSEAGVASLIDPLANYENNPNAVPIGKMSLKGDGGDSVSVISDPSSFLCDIRLENDGEILLDTKTLKGCMTEYYKNKSKTDELIDENGWLHTGDICEMDKNTGYVYFKGRKKDVIVLEEDTRKILPCDIEAVIIKHDCVNECAVVGYPNRLLRYDNVSVGESPCAFIVLNQNYKEKDFDTIIKEIEMLCQENLPPIMQVKKYVFADQLPKTTTNKADKKVLRQRIANGEFQDSQKVM